MSTYAQRVQLGPFFSGGALQGGAKLYHYEAGTSTIKNIWSDRSMTTTLAQPFVADSNGIFNFFADGLYKIIVCGPNSTGPSVDVLHTLDNWSWLDPTDPTFDEGQAVASASNIAVGPEVWLHITGSTNIDTITGTIPFFWAVFDGNLTLNYSASLLTPASINLAVRQNDVVMFLRENAGGTIWRVAAHYHNDGLLISTQDSRTNTVDDALTIRSTTSGTPAAGIGTGMLFQAETTGSSPADVLGIDGQFNDVSASESSTFRVRLRTAGQALSYAWEWLRGTGQFVASLTHSNTANRIYTFQDSSDTVVMRNTTDTLTNKTLTSPTITGNTVGTGAINTATGSASFNAGLVATVTMNDYAFFPSITGAGGFVNMPLYGVHGTADPGNTVGRFRVGLDDDGGGAVNTMIRWRYITSSDDPTMWAAYDPATGQIQAAWASDDPIPGNEPGVQVTGLTSLMLKAQQLEVLSALNARSADAANLIRDTGRRMQHQAYRALQLVANDEAPSRWLLDNCGINLATGRLRMKP